MQPAAYIWASRRRLIGPRAKRKGRTIQYHRQRGIFCLAALIAAAPPASAAQQASGLKAFFRAGQTFITWTECGAAEYRLYRAPAKITDLKAAKLIATVAKGSSSYKLEQTRKVLAKIAGKSGYGERYIIRDNPGAVPLTPDCSCTRPTRPGPSITPSRP